MLVTGPQFIRTVESDGPDVYANLGIAPYPETETGVIPNAIQNMVVPSASDNIEEAILLANWMTNDAQPAGFRPDRLRLPLDPPSGPRPLFL